MSLPRWPEFIALKDQKAHTVAKALYNQWICRYGAPRRILSDRGQNFTGKIIKTLTKFLNINQFQKINAISQIQKLL